jgi:hypothetical protein
MSCASTFLTDLALSPHDQPPAYEERYCARPSPERAHPLSYVSGNPSIPIRLHRKLIHVYVCRSV